MTLRRTILKQEIVAKLYPNSISVKSALQQLRKEINLCPEVKAHMEQAGNMRNHYYNKQQFEILLKHFDLTLEEYNQL